jgi:zinc protease
MTQGHILSLLAFTLVTGATPVLLAQTKAPASKQAPATQLAAPKKITSVEGITEYLLGNGLRVLLYPDASKPTTTVNITYLCGSRHESYGETGMAHILEHILFNGTKRFPDAMKELEQLGGEFNGTTWLDRTHYYVTFPATEEKLKRALEIESDRMRNARVVPEILAKEMKIITNELEIGENNPFRILHQRVNATAFEWQAYGRSTIGAKSDIQNVKLEYVKSYYDRYYQPDNAVLLIAGRFDEVKTLGLVNQFYGRIPRPTRVLHPTYTLDPAQDGEKSVTVRRIGGTPMVIVAYKIPAAAHIDSSTLGVVENILTDTPSGRLHKSLVETKLATQVSSMGIGTREPGLLLFIAVLPKDGDVEKVKTAIIKEVEGIQDRPFTQQEVDQAKTRLTRNIELSLADTKSMAVGLTESVAAGDWRMFFLSRDRLQATTPASAKNAASTYFKNDNRTVGVYLPTDQPVRVEIPTTPDPLGLVANYTGRDVIAQGEAFDATPANVEKRTQIFSAPNGLKGALLPKKTKGSLVTVNLNLHYASVEALKVQPRGAGGLMPDMLMRGTTTKDRKQIQQAFDALKTQVNIGGGPTSLNVTLTTSRENLVASLKLVAEVLKTPAFPASEVDGLIKEQVTQIEAQLKEPQAKVNGWLQKVVNPYPPEHPLAYRSFEDRIVDLKAIQPEQIKGFYTAMIGAQNATFACVGDHDAKEIQALVSDLFGTWNTKTTYQRIPSLMRMAPAERQSFETPDKQMAIYVAFQPLAMAQTDADYPAMLMAGHMYGGSAKSRLFERLRQKENMSYGAGSQFNVDPRDPTGVWLGFALFGPRDRERMETAAMEELKKAVAEGFTQTELDDARKTWLQAREAQRQEDGNLAGWLNECLHLGRPVAYPGELDAKVKATTLDQVNTAIKRHIDPAKTLVAVAGDFAKKN